MSCQRLLILSTLLQNVLRIQCLLVPVYERVDVMIRV